MSHALLQIDSLAKSFGTLTLFENISFGIAEGDKIGLIARNGAGKTTLLNIIAGVEPQDNGRVVFRNDIKLSYLSQDPVFDPEMTVLQASLQAEGEIVDVIAHYEEVIESGDTELMDQAIAAMDRMNAWDYEQRIKQILSQLKIYRFNQKMGELSGGQVKRVALAHALISEPELLILDEPTNHLDLDMVEWLEEYLNRSNISLLMVTHDRYFLDRVCNQIVEIDDMQIYSYKGNYAYYLEKREERLMNQQAETDKARNLMRKELEWMRRQPKARGTKSKSRVEAFYDLQDKATRSRGDEDVKLSAQGSYIGRKIFEAEGITKSFGDIKITEDFSYIFTRYEKMGIIGNNGTGKSTFIKMLLGEVEPDAGNFDIGETVSFGYFSQEGLEFDENTKVIDVVTDIAEVIDLGNGSRLTASQFLNHFLFSPARQHDFVHKLSGGEKQRLHLCTVLIKNPNFLILDEPTNDLDIATLNILEDYLMNYKGCLIVISHDRYFMDKVVDHLLVFNGNADIKEFPGNYTHYRDWKQEVEKLLAQEKREEEKPQKQAEKKVKEKTKLTYREQQEYERLEKEVEEHEAEKEKLSELLSTGTLDTDELLKHSNRIAELIELIDEKTMRWLELSEYA